MHQSNRSLSLCDLCGPLCLCGKCFPKYFHHRDTEDHRVSQRGRRTSLTLSVLLLIQLVVAPVAMAQRTSRNGAHSTTREPLSSADRRIVERPIVTTCAERLKDPSSSRP